MRRSVVFCVLAGLLAASCAPKVTAPALPATAHFPEFVFPAVPAALAADPSAPGVDRGWRYLQNNDLRNADLEFLAAIQRSPQLYPAQAGMAYVALARGDFDRALGGFDQALRAAATYAPALVGRGQALLGLKREPDALPAFEAAVAADPSLADVRRRIDVLRFRVLQDVIEAARAATTAGRLTDAHAAYEKALAASPDSAFLYRELGVVERKQGSAEAALARFRRATDLDPMDSASFVQIGELLEEQRDFVGAEAAYRRAAENEPTPDLARRIAAVADRARDARLPAEFRNIAAAPTVTRGDLAALIGIRLESLLRAAPVTEVVITDTSGHWASSWITQTARAGVIEPFENHTFQPRMTVTRGDLAAAVSRLVTLQAAARPDLRTRFAARPRIADMPETHLSYPAAAIAVSSGVMPLVDGGRFDVSRPVSGAEAVEAVARIQALAAPVR